MGRYAKSNPVSKAVARQQLRHDILAHKTRLYLMAPGEPCREFMVGMGQIFTWMAHACELDKKVGTDNPHYRVLQGAISASCQLHTRDRWDPLQATAIEQGLDAAFALNDKLDPKKIVKALTNLLCS